MSKRTFQPGECFIYSAQLDDGTIRVRRAHEVLSATEMTYTVKIDWSPVLRRHSGRLEDRATTPEQAVERVAQQERLRLSRAESDVRMAEYRLRTATQRLATVKTETDERLSRIEVATVVYDWEPK